MRRDIMIVTGPTGGHFFPGLALAEHLIRKSDCRVFFVVPARERLVAWLRRKRFPYTFLPEAKFSWSQSGMFPLRFLYAFLCSLLLLGRRKPGLVVGTGSYACVPFILAAKLTGRRIVLHEQNFSPGRATGMLARLADAIALSFPHPGRLPKRKCRFTGFPITDEFRTVYPAAETLKEFQLAPDRTTVLVVGGSQSSRYLNSIMEKNLDYFQGKNLQFLHCAGPDKSRLQEAYRKHGVRAAVFDFFQDMGKIYSVCDLAVCRAGAGTLAEISARKIPALLVPYPFAGAHQSRNAGFLADRGVCLVMAQTDANLKQFPRYFEEFLQAQPRLRKNLAGFSIADTDGRLCALVLETVR